MIITTDLIMSWSPCDGYPRSRVQKLVGDGLTPLEVCDLDIPATDRLWVLLRRGVLDSVTLRMLAAAWAERALMRARIIDGRSWGAIRLARLYALGEATGDELAAARRAAWDSAWAAVRDSARYAAWDAAKYAAWDAARAAARYAAWDAVRGAGGFAARAAAWDTAWNAARVAQLADVRRVLGGTSALEG